MFADYLIGSPITVADYLIVSPNTFAHRHTLVQDNVMNSVACHALARMAYIAPDLALPLMHERFEVRSQGSGPKGLGPRAEAPRDRDTWSSM